MRKSKILVSGFLALTLAASLLAAMPIWADEARPASSRRLDDLPKFNKRVAGVYLVTGQPPSGPPFLLIFNVYRDRMISTSAQVQGTTLSGTAFIDDQGIWKKSGRRQITARLLSFNYLPPGTQPPDGGLHSNRIADIFINFSNGYSGVSGSFTVTTYPFDSNPLAPDAEPLGPPSVILFEGSRLTLP